MSFIYLCTQVIVIANMFSFFHWTVGDPQMEEPDLSLALSV